MLNWYQSAETHPLIKSFVFHYEFEFIHPFTDGNGRMGRMWHSLLLGKWNELFYWLPIEALARQRQTEYYDALGKPDRDVGSCAFAELMLEVILDALKGISVVGNSDQARNIKHQAPTEKLLFVLGNEELSATELVQRPGLSHRRTFRKNYLNPSMEQGLLEMTLPDKPNSRNQKYRKA